MAADKTFPSDIELQIADLRLDPENPRIISDEGQINIRQALLDDQGSKIAELAFDIQKFGLNPMDRLMVLQPDPKKSEYIALEGNRRVAALQILRTPELMQDLSLPDTLRNRLTELADSFKSETVEPIKAVQMADRETARRWIELRHTGQNNGRGIVDWNGVQTARFRGDKTLKILEFVKTKGNLAPVEFSSIDSNFPITTLDRIISNPLVRQKIGVQIVDGEFYLSYPVPEQVKVLKRIVLDLATKKINVSSLKNKEQQLSYIDGFPPGILPSGPKLKPPVALTHVLSIVPPSPPSPPPPPPSPLNRKTLIPTGFSLSLPNQKAAQLFYELKTLNLDKFPVAGAITLRSFVEAIVEIYCNVNAISTVHKSEKSPGKSLSLSGKVEAVLQHFSGKLTKGEQTAARTALTSKDSVISVNRLNEYVHNPAVFPSKNDLIAAWSGVEAFFRVACK